MPKFTASQQLAINSEGKDILVSAAAGSGKTTVLVNRVLRKIKSGTSIDQLLIVTFTKAAAAEMKTRIKTTLSQEIKTNPQNRFLRIQLNQIDTANISTIDAFCLDLIRRFYYVINLNPSFSILTDSTQAALLKEQALHDIENAAFTNHDADFIDFYNNFAGDRDVADAEQLLLDLYDYAVARPNYQTWLQHLADNYLQQGSLVDMPIFQQAIKPYLLKTFKSLAIKIGQLLAQAAFKNPELKKVNAAFTDFQHKLTIFLQQLAADSSYEQLQQALKQCQFTTNYRKSKKWDETTLAVYEQSQQLKTEAKNLVYETYQKFFVAAGNEQIKVEQKAKKLCQIISKTELALIKHFQELKQAQNFLDFSDLEQLAQQILSQDSSQAQLARDYYHHKFKEILIDEYQDINPLQEEILSQLKGKNNHIFMVGDVKQSIYGFRQADPGLFLQKYQAFPQQEQSQRIILEDNFRSTKAVDQLVNRIFKTVMTTDFGGIDYQKEGQLHFAATYYPENLPDASEFLYLETAENKKEQDNQDDFELAAEESQLIIKRIKQLQAENFQVFDPKIGKKRALQYSDIAILTRSRSNNNDIRDAFANAGIPLFLTDAQNYFQTFELTIAMNYLKIIDNPDQDIPLVSVLRSPLYNFQEPDFARIRIKSRHSSFYSAVTNYVANNDKLANRIKQFLNQLEHLRNFATKHRISELIWELYEQTNLLEIVTAMPNGEQRRVNLEALYERASQYESAGFKGLFQFINFINHMRRSQKDLAQPLLSKDSTNSVRLMTIHGAKGLEFPIVFYLGAGHRYQMRDLHENYIITQDLLGLTVKRPHYRVDSWLKSWAEIVKRRQKLEEESRILYVALTRAKQKLIIVAKGRDLKKKAQTWQQDLIAGELPLTNKLTAQTALDFLGPSLNLDQENSYALTDLSNQLEQKLDFLLVKLPEQELIPAATTAETDKSSETETVNPLLLKTSQKLFSFKYPFTDASQTAGYQSVSELKRLFNDPDEEELANSQLEKSNNRYLQAIETKPQFLFPDQVAAPEIGTAMHLILQYYDYSGKYSPQKLTEEIKSLLAKKQLAPGMVKHLQLDQIDWFVTSDFSRRFWQHPERLHREESFSSLISASRLYPNFSDPNAKILVHGTIDGYYQDRDGICLFDYKTDFVDLKHKKAAIAKIKQKYRGQLRLYEQALNSYCQQPVKHKYLILLAAKEIVELTD
jgi:ATP-dependent helicase/nuclease subunit A